MRLWNLAAVAILAALYEGLYSVWTYSVAHNLPVLAVVSTFLLPLIQLAGVCFFIEAKGWRGKLAVALATSAGYSVGTGLLLWMLPR